jgi:phospholipid/cholesterol/gamma-HCH transport system ATP-binding protein
LVFAVIHLRGVNKRFAEPVLRNVNLQVPEGCLYGLIGPGASGKSLLLKIIAGLITPDAGEVLVHGQDVAKLDESELYEFRKGVGMLFQNNALFDFLNVRENIAFPLRRLFHVSESDVDERVGERLARVGLAGFEGREPAGLSGGQKKRVGLARATVCDAPLVLYDEPAAGLDPVTSQRIFSLLRQEQQTHKATAVMVSSDLDRLLPVCDRVGMMYRGRIIFDGTPDEARASQNPYLYQFLRGLPDGPL